MDHGGPGQKSVEEVHRKPRQDQTEEAEEGALVRQAGQAEEEEEEKGLGEGLALPQEGVLRMGRAFQPHKYRVWRGSRAHWPDDIHLSG